MTWCKNMYSFLKCIYDVRDAIGSFKPWGHLWPQVWRHSNQALPLVHTSYNIITRTSDDFSKLSEGCKSCFGNLGSLHWKEKTGSFRYTECWMDGGGAAFKEDSGKKLFIGAECYAATL